MYIQVGILPRKTAFDLSAKKWKIDENETIIKNDSFKK